MKYERLTERDKYGRAILKDETVNKDIVESNLKFDTLTVLDKIVSQFCDLEDKIENGTLVELPCKVGDKVWVIAKQGMDIYTVEETTIVDFWFYPNKNRFYPIDINEIPIETVFLTKDEAEKRLEELQKEDDYEDFRAMALGYDEFRLPQKN